MRKLLSLITYLMPITRWNIPSTEMIITNTLRHMYIDNLSKNVDFGHFGFHDQLYMSFNMVVCIHMRSHTFCNGAV